MSTKTETVTGGILLKKVHKSQKTKMKLQKAYIFQNTSQCLFQMEAAKFVGLRLYYPEHHYFIHHHYY